MIRSGMVAALLAVTLTMGAPAMADSPPAGPYGAWAVEEIGGQPVAAGSRVTIDLGADGRATGTGGCNRFSGSAKIDDGAIAFGPMASTKMMCAPDVSDQEAKFFHALEQVRNWTWDGPGLVLLDAAGKTVLRLGAAS
ncbi:META domain-containing protein [Kumtagia ephedrae]|nr:META domain-containing protein [Mesorhizobium ephedrae]